MVKVGFLGPKGTYTHQAVLQQFGEDIEIFPLLFIGDCFKEVNANNVDYAVVPFENSTNGQVIFTYDLMRDWYIDTPRPSFRIVGEQFVPIHHNLLSKELDLSNIKKIYSHPQVWGQVTNFMDTIDHPVTKVDCSSTSKAAELVKISNEPGVACISSSMCSKLYNLPIIQADIENNISNSTRFLILGESPLSVSETRSTDITSLIFTVDQAHAPGSLRMALLSFQEYEINIININSRPSNKGNWQYAFFVEFIGNYITDDNVKQSLKSLETKCTEIVILGTFQRTNFL